MRTLFSLSVLFWCTATFAAERPNVVMFAVDDMCDWIGPMGHAQAITPNLDRLAASGVTFQNPAKAKDRSVLLPGMKPGEYAMINQDWRYIRYADGGEELYDIRQDPNEWKNLAGNVDFASVREQLMAAAPTSFAEPGASKRELRLVIEGESFEWRSKRRPAAKIVPKSIHSD